MNQKNTKLLYLLKIMNKWQKVMKKIKNVIIEIY